MCFLDIPGKGSPGNGQYRWHRTKCAFASVETRSVFLSFSSVRPVACFFLDGEGGRSDDLEEGVIGNFHKKSTAIGWQYRFALLHLKIRLESGNAQWKPGAYLAAAFQVFESGALREGIV